MVLLAGHLLIQIEINETMKPMKSENKCAASVMTAKLPAIYPPINSVICERNKCKRE